MWFLVRDRWSLHVCNVGGQHVKLSHPTSNDLYPFSLSFSLVVCHQNPISFCAFDMFPSWRIFISPPGKEMRCPASHFNGRRNRIQLTANGRIRFAADYQIVTPTRATIKPGERRSMRLAIQDSCDSDFAVFISPFNEPRTKNGTGDFFRVSPICAPRRTPNRNIIGKKIAGSNDRRYDRFFIKVCRFT